MKKISMILVIIITIFSTTIVYAKDSVYSLNKNKDEHFRYVINGYDETGNKDGFILGGDYLKEIDNQEDYQIMLVKYNKKGAVKWKYTYGKTKKDYLDYLTYTYNSEGKIDGYALVLAKTYNTDDSTKEVASTFVKVGLDGKYIAEKDSNLQKQEHIVKIVETTENGNFNGYLAIANNTDKTSSFLVKYDRDFNVVWSKEKAITEKDNIEYTDIISIKEDNNTIGCVIIEEKKIGDNLTKDLVHFDNNGNVQKETAIDLEKYSTTSLSSSESGYILYGITPEVKVKKGEKSYCLNHYTNQDENDWESIGDIPVDDNKKMILLPQFKDNKITSYTLLYSNSSDHSYEVITLDQDGLLKKKIKKINNEYYDIEGYLTSKNTIYLAGQINCPEDETCEYDGNSLFLVSDEDKVIEVEDNDSTNIIVISSIAIVGLIGIFIFRKKIKR